MQSNDVVQTLSKASALFTLTFSFFFKAHSTEAFLLAGWQVFIHHHTPTSHPFYSQWDLYKDLVCLCFFSPRLTLAPAILLQPHAMLLFCLCSNHNTQHFSMWKALFQQFYCIEIVFPVLYSIEVQLLVQGHTTSKCHAELGFKPYVLAPESTISPTALCCLSFVNFSKYLQYTLFLSSGILHLVFLLPELLFPHPSLPNISSPQEPSFSVLA